MLCQFKAVEHTLHYLLIIILIDNYLLIKEISDFTSAKEKFFEFNYFVKKLFHAKRNMLKGVLDNVRYI